MSDDTLRGMLARVPGYGGLIICDVIGETDRHYSLRFTQNALKHPLDYVTSDIPDDAPRELVSTVFVRRKSKCYPIADDLARDCEARHVDYQ